jgi:hypothetical protein
MEEDEEEKCATRISGTEADGLIKGSLDRMV